MTGCVPHVVTFSGEDENWEIAFEITDDSIKKEQCAETSGHIRYIGDEQIPKKIQYKIDHSYETSDTLTLNSEGTAQFIKDCSYATEGSTVEITVEWDEKIAIFPLLES